MMQCIVRSWLIGSSALLGIGHCPTLPNLGEDSPKAKGRLRGLAPRSVGPSISPDVQSQVETGSHWKGLPRKLHQLSDLSGSDSSGKKDYFKQKSRPLKRRRDTQGFSEDPLKVKLE